MNSERSSGDESGRSAPFRGDKQSLRSLNEFDRARLLAEICRLYFVDRKGQKEIVERLRPRGVTDVTVVSRLIEEARLRGVVSFDIDESFGATGREDAQLSRELRDTFELNEALVVEIDAQDDKGDGVDDYLHIVLANHAGMQLRNQIASDDHCAVAGGRAVNQVVRMIKRDPPLRKNVRITPMSGRLWSHQWQVSGPSIMRPLDPDDSAFILFEAFANEPGTVFDQVGHPLFADSKKHAMTIMKEHCTFLPGGKWSASRAPNRAIVGVGAIGGGHRLADCTRNPFQRKIGSGDHQKELQELLDRYLAKARSQLTEAIETVSAQGLYFGDVANRYFPTLPMPDEMARMSREECDRMYKKLFNQLEDLNQRMVVVDWAHLRSIPSVTAVAGGPFKLRALWTILFVGLHEKAKRIVSSVVTDATMAQNLVTALHKYKNCDASTQSWYRTVADRLFS